MTNQTFDRFEDKYIIQRQQYLGLKDDLATYGEIDRFGRYPIGSVYFDNDSFVLANQAISNPKTNQKLRLRKYSHKNFQSNDIVMYEKKERLNGRILKQRTSLEFQKLFPSSNTPNDIDIQNEILSSLHAFRQLHQLSPRLLVKYYREAYFFPQIPDLRVTFDSQIHCCRFSSFDTDTSKHKSTFLLQEDSFLLEIKYDSAIPDWLKGLLDKHNILQSDFSKYIRACQLLFL